MNPNTPAVTGKDQIRASMKLFFDDPASMVEYHIMSVEVANLAISAPPEALTGPRSRIQLRRSW